MGRERLRLLLLSGCWLLGAGCRAPEPRPVSAAAVAAAPAPDREIPLERLVDVSRLPSSVGCAVPHRPQPARSAAPPSAGVVTGSIDKEVIRRIIQDHVPVVKACYDARMIAPPYPQGRLVVRFLIDRAGLVSGSCAEESSVSDPEIDRCILDAILLWVFPEPVGAGVVVVSYPFVLTPEDDPPKQR